MRHGRLLLVALSVGLLLHVPPASAEKVLRLRPLAVATRHLEEGPLRQPRGVALDRKSGEIWVADSRNHLLGAFTPEGTPLFCTNGGGTMREPTQVAVDGEGGLWVLDLDRSRIVRLDWRGSPLPGPALDGLPERPVIGAIAFDENGGLYLGENAEGRIHVFDRSLRPRFQFGSRGTDDGQFQAISGIAVAGDWIGVVDARARPVQLFNRRGEFERAWGAHDIGRENFSLPEGIAFDSKGHVIVVDALRHEIKFFDLQGKFLGRFGGFGFGPGQVAHPTDVAVDASDRLYVVEKGNGRVQVFAIEEVERQRQGSAPRVRSPAQTDRLSSEGLPD